MDITLFSILFVSALAGSYFVLKEFTEELESGRENPRLVFLEAGGLFLVFLWGVIAFHSFEVTHGNAVVIAEELTSVALLAVAGAIINGLVFVQAISEELR